MTMLHRHGITLPPPVSISQKQRGLSDLHIPATWPSQPNRYTLTAHELTKQQALRLKLIDARGIAKFDASAFALLSGYACPEASLERLTVFNDWHSWLFFFDDQADEHLNVYSSRHNLEAQMNECLSVLRTGRLRPKPTGLERFTQDIRNRLRHYASGAWLARFADDVADYLFQGTLKTIENWEKRMVPDVEPYLVQRRYDSAVYTCQDLLEVTDEDLELSNEILTHPEFARLRHLCTDVVAFSNDIFSYEKEVLRHQNPNNLLHVLMVHQSLSFAKAVDRTVGIINQAIESFSLIEQERAVEIAENRKLSAYVQGLKAWMRGNLLWSFESGRYASPTSPFPELRLASGEACKRAPAGK